MSVCTEQCLSREICTCANCAIRKEEGELFQELGVMKWSGFVAKMN